MYESSEGREAIRDQRGSGDPLRRITRGMPTPGRDSFAQRQPQGPRRGFGAGLPNLLMAVARLGNGSDHGWSTAVPPETVGSWFMMPIRNASSSGTDRMRPRAVRYQSEEHTSELK